mgnify:FL=1|tara:strand:- start:2 stop:184 length:183 start_codon:yes stop_codon:yes gene_type:complete
MARIIELEKKVDILENKLIRIDARLSIQERLLQSITTKVLGKENAEQKSKAKQRRKKREE